MTAPQVIVGWVLVAVQLTACAVAGHGLRRRLVPSWRGPHATLAAGVASIAVLVGVGEILGSVGLLRRWALPIALVAIAWLLRPRQKTTGAEPAPQETTAVRSQAVRIAALIATAAVAASWVERVAAVYRRGLTDGDSMMYHLVFAARFVQSGWTTGADPVGPDAWVAFYPANVELIQATLVLPFGTDVLVPLLNLGWLTMALAASWCIGAEVGRGLLGLVMGAVVASVPVMVVTQAGTARVDIAVVALVLAAVALVLHHPRSTGSCAVAGLALGLAIGSKFAVLPLAGLLLVGVAFALLRREGRGAALAWSGATVAAGGYWYVRNWVVTGSPVPAIDLRVFGVGFTPLSADRRELLDGSSIVENVGRPGFWSNIARPVAENMFGTPVITAAVIVAAVVVIIGIAFQRPIGVRHAVVVAAVGGCVAYVFAPYSAPLLDASTDGPFASLIVALNVRYLLPALAVLLGLLPVALDRFDRFGRLADAAVGVGSAAVAYLWIDNRGFDAEWPTTDRDSLVAVALVAVVVGATLVGGVTVSRRARPPRGPAAPAALGALTVCLVAAVALTAWVATGRSGAHRHDDLPVEQAQLWQAANDVPGEDVALLEDWVQYPLMGVSLDRDVDFVGLPREQGMTEPPRTCDEVETVLAGDRYDLVVVQRPLLAGRDVADHIDCLREAQAELVFQNAAGAVFRLG